MITITGCPLVKFKFCKDIESACYKSDLIVIHTEWNEFKDLEWTEIYKSMNKPSWIFDGRNILEKSKFEKIGFKFKGIGN